MSYTQRIKDRSRIRFILGLIARIKNYILNELVCFIARINGASIGKNTYVNFRLAWKSNSNLIIGYDCIVETDKLDLREKIIIENNVIINRDVTILRQSHDFDSTFFETVGNPLLIESFVWITTGTTILPSCAKIKKGAICGSFSVITKDVEEMAIMGGNPAKILKFRKNLPLLLNIPAMQGRDLHTYWLAKNEKY